MVKWRLDINKIKNKERTNQEIMLMLDRIDFFSWFVDDGITE